MIETFSLFGNDVSIYYFTWFLATVAVLIQGYILGKDVGFGFSKSIIYVALTVVLSLMLLWATAWVFGGGQIVTSHYIRVVSFAPIPLLLLTRLFRDPFWKGSDFQASGFALYQAIAHVGCIFPGCCHGYPSKWGFYSNMAGTVCFPVQALEIAASLLVAIILLVMFKKGCQRGRLYAWFLVLFGGSRFFLEFLRDNEKVIGNVSELALHALAATVIGLVWLAVMHIIQKRSTQNEETEI